MIVGMDFGTTNSGMSVFDGDNLQLIPLDPVSINPVVARSAIYITNDRDIFIGQEALKTYYEQNLNRPFKLERVRVGEIEMTFAEVGTFLQDVFVEKDIFSQGRLFLSFKMGLSSPDFLGTVVGSEYYFLEDVIATYLYVTRKRAEAHLKRDIDTIVLGRPVNFSEDDRRNKLARERLLQAAFRAGYRKVYLQYEPIAAAYHYEMTVTTSQHVVIFDFGGGTLDISVMRLGGGEKPTVLATGGVPIAGDVFDRKIVRNKIPPHFGEGGIYRHGDQELPVPASFYETFSNWQELLMMQLPERLEKIKQIMRVSNVQRKMNALISLITSNYGLKMYDLAEAAKRQLSSEPLAYLKLDGPGFFVRDTLSRNEFERLIRSDVRRIAQCLDTVIADAGLGVADIDCVIRTGGSSQIPAFIDMLNGRFSPDKVRDLDTFSSVTSGLGIIAYRIEQGEIDLPCYTPDEHMPGDYLNSTHQGGIPVVDFEMMKKFLDLQEEQNRTRADINYTVIIKSSTDRLEAVEYSQQHLLEGIEFESPIDVSLAHVIIDFLPSEERILLMTTDYRFLLKSARQLAGMRLLDIELETTEGFYSDDFGDEVICGTIHWEQLQDAPMTALITTRGYVRIFIGKSFVDKLGQPVPYQVERSKGYPLLLVNVGKVGDLIAIASSGRAIRVAANDLTTKEQLLIKGGLIHAFYNESPQDMIVVTASGYSKRIRTSVITKDGVKLIGRSKPTAAIQYKPDQQLLAITTHRIVPINQELIPLLNMDTTDYKLLRLRKSERVIKLAYLR